MNFRTPGLLARHGFAYDSGMMDSDHPYRHASGVVELPMHWSLDDWNRYNYVPQSIAIGAAAVGLVGKESDLFRFTVKHSFIMLFVICLLTCMQAYLTPWIIPVYKKIEGATAAEVYNASKGFTYLLVLAVALFVIVSSVLLVNKKKTV